MQKYALGLYYGLKLGYKGILDLVIPHNLFDSVLENTSLIVEYEINRYESATAPEKGAMDVEVLHYRTAEIAESQGVQLLASHPERLPVFIFDVDCECFCTSC